MSVLIAIKDKDRVVVGVDTRMCCGPSFTDSYKQRPKAYHIDSKRSVIVGGVGNIGLVDLMKMVMENHINNLDSIDRSYIVRYIVPKLINEVKAFSMEDKEHKMDGEVLIAIKDRGYVIHGDYCVEELESFTAIGSGTDSANGSLFTTELFITSTEDRIAIAIEATGHCISNVSSEAIIGDTSGKSFALYNRKLKKK